jgi:hypothetical protein
MNPNVRLTCHGSRTEECAWREPSLSLSRADYLARCHSVQHPGHIVELQEPLPAPVEQLAMFG